MLVARREQQLRVTERAGHRCVDRAFVVVADSGQGVQARLHGVDHRQVFLLPRGVERLLFEFFELIRRQVHQLDAHFALLIFRGLADAGLEPLLDLHGGPHLRHLLHHQHGLTGLLALGDAGGLDCSQVFGVGRAAGRGDLCSRLTGSERSLTLSRGGAFCSGSLLVDELNRLLDLGILPLHFLDHGFDRGGLLLCRQGRACELLLIATLFDKEVVGVANREALAALAVSARRGVAAQLLAGLLNARQLGHEPLAFGDDATVVFALGGQCLEAGRGALVCSLLGACCRRQVGAVELDDRRHGILDGRRQLFELAGVFAKPLICVGAGDALEGVAELLDALGGAGCVFAHAVDAVGDPHHLADQTVNGRVKHAEIGSDLGQIAANASDAFVKVGSDLGRAFQVLFEILGASDGLFERATEFGDIQCEGVFDLAASHCRFP